MRHALRLFAVALLGILTAASPARAQKRPPVEFLEPFPPVEETVDDLRGWLDGTLKPRGKAPPVDPKMLGDLLSKMKEGRQDGDPGELQNLLKNNPQFKNPDFLRMLEQMRRDGNFPQNLKGQLDRAGQNRNLPDQIPDLKDKLGNLVDQAKKPEIEPGRIPDVKPPDLGGNGDNGGKGDFPKPPEPGASQTRPPLDPVAQEWVKWMEKNFGDSPAGQQAVKEMIDAMGKNDLKGVFDDLPDFKTGEWKEINDWGKGNLGDAWKFSPPDWNLSGGGSAPKFSGGGSGLNFGGPPSVGSLGGGGVQAAGGGLSVVAIVIGAIGACFIAYLLYRKWQKEEEARQAMIAASRRELDLTRIRNREELVEAFDTLTLEKLGDESRNWNHRVVTETFVETKPEAAEPAQELGELYQKARYAPPQDDLTTGELSAAERDLRTVAGVNP